MSGEAETLPLAHVKRVVRSKLAEVAGEGGAGGGADKAKKEVTVQKEALAALAEAGRMFIHYLTGTANELCQESKRLTINADDVLRALDEIEFSEFAEPLRETLTGACDAGDNLDSCRPLLPVVGSWGTDTPRHAAFTPATRSFQGCTCGEAGQQRPQAEGRGRNWR
jgi:DNA polymerase epsilon subunit 3